MSQNGFNLIFYQGGAGIRGQPGQPGAKVIVSDPQSPLFPTQPGSHGQNTKEYFLQREASRSN